MTAAQVIESLRARGGQLHLLEGGHLGAAPASALTDDLRAEIRAHKTELVQVLQSEASQPTQSPTARRASPV